MKRRERQCARRYVQVQRTRRGNVTEMGALCNPVYISIEFGTVSQILEIFCEFLRFQ